MQELEDELKENNMKWDVIGLGEVRRKEESFTTLQSGHLPYHSEANNGQAGVGFLKNKKWKDNITRVSSGSSRVAELVLRITDIYQLKIVQVYAPTISQSDEDPTKCIEHSKTNQETENPENIIAYKSSDEEA